MTPVYVALSAILGPSTLVTSLTPTALSVSVNTSMIGAGTQQAVATADFAQASGVNITAGVTNWVSSNPSVLTVDSGGLITAVNGGSATVSATVNGVTATSASITVASTPPVFTQKPAGASVAIGGLAHSDVGGFGWKSSLSVDAQ